MSEHDAMEDFWRYEADRLALGRRLVSRARNWCSFGLVFPLLALAAYTMGKDTRSGAEIVIVAALLNLVVINIARAADHYFANAQKLLEGRGVFPLQPLRSIDVFPAE